jgi:phage tail P2-like protein
MTDRSLLPPSATALERAITEAAAPLGALPVSRLWDPWACPAAALPALAWALSVDEWGDAWPEEVKRQVCADALPVHARKGTVGSVRQVLRSVGLIDEARGYTAHIVEGISAFVRNGTATHNGTRTRGETAQWAAYRVTLNRPITIAQAALVRRQLDATAPARCTLDQLNFTATAWLRNGTRLRNGTITYGAA